MPDYPVYQGMLTPSQAEGLLAKNTRNCKLTRSRVNRIKAQIERGEWIFDGNPIKVSATDVILDGQHRLTAIAAAGVPVETLILYGLPDAAQLVMDTGRTRDFEDYLTIRGVTDARALAAATKVAWAYQHGGYDFKGDWFNREIPSHGQLWELFTARKDAIVAGAAASAPVTRHIKASRAVIAGAHVIIGDITCDICGDVATDRDQFYAALAGKRNDVTGANKFAKIMNGKKRDQPSALSSGYSQRVQLALLLKAWNAYREGREVTTLKFTLGGAHPEKFPIPH